MSAVLTPNQKAWVAALRSGEYPQTNACLKRDGAYCCLGVASEISDVPGEWIEANLTDSGVRHSFVIEAPTPGGPDIVSETYAPAAVLRWLGSNSTTGDSDYDSGDVYFDVPPNITNLREQGAPDMNPLHIGVVGPLSGARMNDDGFTFSQIADCVEYFGIKP